MKKFAVVLAISLLVFGATSIYSQVGPGEESPSLSPGLTATPDPELTPDVVTTPADKKKVKTSSRRLKQVSGQITAIDREGKSITVGGITVRTDENTLSNLKEGDSVTVDYVSKGMHKAIVILREVK